MHCNPATTMALSALPRHIPFQRALFLISVPVTPSMWPSSMRIASPLIGETEDYLKQYDIKVNASYAKSIRADRTQSHEHYRARLVYPDGQTFNFPNFCSASLEEMSIKQAARYTSRADAPSSTSREAEILVCTHGSRDCRCSFHGEPLVQTLRQSIARRGLNINVSEITHVGGHRFAANAIILPSLDMLSNLRVDDAPDVLNHALGVRSMTAHWRGRIGLTETEQRALWQRMAAEATSAKVIQPSTVRLVFRTHDGDIRAVEADIGSTLLEVGKANALPAMEGACGGNLECATCHLYIRGPVAAPTEAEVDMVSCASDYNESSSRLACQIPVTAELGVWAERGGIIQLPKY